MDLVVILWKILFHRLGCRPMENFCSIDFVVVLWKSLFFFFVTIDLVIVLWIHICIFFAIDLIVVSWKFPFLRTWLSSYGEFLVSWTWLSSYENFSVPWTWLLSYGRFFLFHGLGFCPMEDSWI